MGLAILASAVLAACSSDAAPPPTPTAEPTATVAAQADVQIESSVETTYYDVEGSNTEAIFGDIERNGPTDDSGRRGSGLTSVDWEYVWEKDERADGTCAIATMTIRADMTMELPRHANDALLPPATLTKWQEFTEGVARHEQRHVEIYEDGAEDLKVEMESIGVKPDCETLTGIVENIWKDGQARINAQQEAFHEEEDVRIDARRAPLQSQIDANRSELDVLESRIRQLDAEIASLRDDIEALDDEVYSIDAQIQQIYDQFPNELPPTVQARLESLVLENNELLTTFNQKVDRHKATLSERNALFSQYQELLNETNALVDEYNWSR